MSDLTLETGDYIDLAGRKWFCVAETKKKRMVCNSYDGYFTVAGYSTFRVWGWKPAPSVPSDKCGGGA